MVYAETNLYNICYVIIFMNVIHGLQNFKAHFRNAKWTLNLMDKFPITIIEKAKTSVVKVGHIIKLVSG